MESIISSFRVQVPGPRHAWSEGLLAGGAGEQSSFKAKGLPRRVQRVVQITEMILE